MINRRDFIRTSTIGLMASPLLFCEAEVPTEFKYLTKVVTDGTSVGEDGQLYAHFRRIGPIRVKVVAGGKRLGVKDGSILEQAENGEFKVAIGEEAE